MVPILVHYLIIVLVALGGATAPRALAAQSDATFLVIVHPSNAIAELSRTEVRDLFLRRKTAWSSSLKADPIDLAPKMPVRSQFSREVLVLSTTAVTNYWMQEIFGGGKTPPPVMSTVAAAVSYVASTPGAIAYVPRDTPAERVRIVRVVP